MGDAVTIRVRLPNMKRDLAAAPLPFAWALAAGACLLGCATTPTSSGRPNDSGSVGAFVLSGGEPAGEPLRRFVALAGGPNAKIVYVPTAASGLLLPSRREYIPPDTGIVVDSLGRDAQGFAALLGVARVTLLHTRDRARANSDTFLAPLREATGVWFSGGNAGRLADAYLETRVVDALLALGARGGVIGGQSAGAIIHGAFIIRGRPDKPVLMAPGRMRGFALLPGLALNPHLSSQRRENELITVLDAYPELYGLGLDDSVAVIVRGDTAEVVGTGRVAIYNNQRYSGSWYRWVRPGSRIDLRRREPIP